jgi:hypothetical protein
MTCSVAAYGFVCSRTVDDGCFLDRVNLIAHEAGHLFFCYFGDFMHVLGGTLGQLIVPIGIATYFATRREFYSSAISLFWVGENFLNISVYVKDAAAMELPLVSLGGGDSIHDWNWLLLKFNVLAYDQLIGNLVFGAGVLTMAVSVLIACYFSFEEGKG